MHSICDAGSELWNSKVEISSFFSFATTKKFKFFSPVVIRRDLRFQALLAVQFLFLTSLTWRSMCDVLGKAMWIALQQQPGTNVSTMQFLYSIDDIVDIVVQWPNCLLP